MLSQSRIDTHSHILPGIDDGCPDVADSLDCVRQFIAAGYVGTICTPHVIPGTYPRNVPSQICVWVATLQQALVENGIDYQLWAGGEILLAPDNWDMFERDGVPTLGPSRAVLMDWWGLAWPEFADRTIDRLQAEGYQPILAHPERMRMPVSDLQRLVETLTRRGVWLQGNLNSLSGGEGLQAQELSHEWLQAGIYHLLASDSHHPERLSGRLAGLQTAIELVGEVRVADLTARRTRELVQLAPE